MTLRHLKVFVTVVECEKITLAGEKLYIAQPAISQTIKELEKYYNKKLFERLNRKLYITEEGKLLYEKAKKILADYNDIESTFSSYGDNSLRIGFTLSIANTIMKDILTANNTVNYTKIIVDNTDTIENMLLKCELDIALVEGKVTDKDLIVKPFLDDEIVFVHHKNCMKNAKKTFIHREQGSGTRDLIEGYFAQNDIHYDNFYYSSGIDSIRILLGIGLGVTAMSKRLVASELASGELVQIEQKERILRKFSVVYHKDKLITNAIETVMQSVANYEEIAHRI